MSFDRDWDPKRCLPHQHLIIKFEGDSPGVRGEIDKWVRAQLPPSTICKGRLRDLVLKYMVHRKRGTFNPNAPCIPTDNKANKKLCKSFYPQPFRSRAVVNEKTGRVEYCRPNNNDCALVQQHVDGVSRQVRVTNQDVVPYNPYLLLKYQCHIYVDVVTSSSVVKYLYKYVHKGQDFALVKISTVVNEIE